MSVPSILALFQSFVPGPRLIDGGELGQLANQLFSCQSGITALAGGGQAGATQLTAAKCQVSVCATNSDSVMLPQAIPGAQVYLENATAQTLAVFGQTANALTGVGDTIAAHNSNTQQATATGVTQATTVPALYTCIVAGQWKQFLG